MSQHTRQSLFNPPSIGHSNKPCDAEEADNGRAASLVGCRAPKILATGNSNL